MSTTLFYVSRTPQVRVHGAPGPARAHAAAGPEAKTWTGTQHAPRRLHMPRWILRQGFPSGIPQPEPPPGGGQLTTGAGMVYP